MASISTCQEGENYYDYIIIGGGTAGLTVAARLSENPNAQVLILEAGDAKFDDPKINTPAMMTSMYGDENYDWNYSTTPQTHLDNRTIAYPRGRVLGGTSAINFLMVSNPSRLDLDNWERLGNSGWNYESMIPYFQKSESFHLPPEPGFWNEKLHGHQGPIQHNFPKGMGELDLAWGPTFETLGLDPKCDPRGEEVLGGYSLPKFMDGNAGRSYASTGYYLPNAGRSNLHLLTNTFVKKIELKKVGNEVVTVGVKYERDGKETVVKTKQTTGEVILCAGTVGSPQMLEISGIGGRERLEGLGVKVIVENESVGENLQDHALLGIAYEVVPGIATAETLKQPGVMEWALNEYTTKRAGPLSTGVTGTAFLSHQSLSSPDDPQSLPSNLASMRPPSSHPGISKQLDLQEKQLLNSNEADLQFNFGATGINPHASNDTSQLFTVSDSGNYVGTVPVLTHPFSRGSIHITDTNPRTHPAIDVNFLAHSLDEELLIRGLLFAQKLSQTPPLSNLLRTSETGEKIIQPSFGLPNTISREIARAVVKAGTISSWHPVGTCSMLPKEDGGVVDERLRVYGCKGLRVVDASVIPLIGRGNIASVVYALAERAADLIKEDRPA